MEPFPAIADLVALHESDEGQILQTVSEALDRIERYGTSLGAILTVDRERSLRAAGKVARRLASGEKLPLCGVPVAVKDNICTRDWPTTCGSRILQEYRPQYDATVISRLERAGAVIVCKTNMDEFGMGSSTENSASFPCHNPWDPGRTPGGSSGGSAAVVAAGLAPVALGSDTGGSIRQPAAFCGITGLKPTYGRVSRHGLVAFASSLDQVGPMTRTVEDTARIFEAIAGHDPLDATSARSDVVAGIPELDMGVEGLRVGLPIEYAADAVDEGIVKQVTAAASLLEEKGAKIREISLPHTRHAVPAYYLVATAEASSNLARHDGVHAGRRGEGASSLLEMYTKGRSQGLGAEVVRRILLGTYSLSTGGYERYYMRAMQTRTLLLRDFENAWNDVDVILAATTPTTAFALGKKTSDPLEMYLADILTTAANLAGVPSLSVPVGFIEDAGTRLPVGAQLMGPLFSEALLFRAGRAIEAAVHREGVPLAPPPGSSQ